MRISEQAIEAIAGELDPMEQEAFLRTVNHMGGTPDRGVIVYSRDELEQVFGQNPKIMKAISGQMDHRPYRYPIDGMDF